MRLSGVIVWCWNSCLFSIVLVVYVMFLVIVSVVFSGLFSLC